MLGGLRVLIRFDERSPAEPETAQLRSFPLMEEHSLGASVARSESRETFDRARLRALVP